MPQPSLLGTVPLDVLCRCGHERGDHFGHTERDMPTGAEASFGGTACELCWACGTFNSADLPGSAMTQPARSESAHVHEWHLPDGPYFVIDTYPPKEPYHCECGAFTHDPETGEPCRTCNPEDYARRTSDVVLLVGGPFDGTHVARPANKTVRFRVDPPAKRVQKYVTYKQADKSDGVFEFYSNGWAVPHEPRGAE